MLAPILGLIFIFANTVAYGQNSPSGGPSSSYPAASWPLPKKIDIGDRTYSGEQIFLIFRDVALGGKANLPRRNALLEDNVQHELKALYPQIYKLVYEDRVRQEGGVYKWNAPIFISMGFQNDLKPAVPPSINGKKIDDLKRWPYDLNGKALASWFLTSTGNAKLFGEALKKRHEAEKIVEDEINKNVSDLQHLTHLNVSYLPHSQDNSESKANVRIVLVADPKAESWISDFKRGDGISKSLAYDQPTPVDIRSLITSDSASVNFTSASRRQVDGFLFANGNDIDGAYCFIWQEHGAEVIRSLVRECLVRSLGFPGASSRLKEVNDSLSLWNEGGPDAQSSISELDKYLINLLYDPQLKAGMSDLDLMHLVQ